MMCKNEYAPVEQRQGQEGCAMTKPKGYNLRDIAREVINVMAKNDMRHDLVELLFEEVTDELKKQKMREVSKED